MGKLRLVIHLLIFACIGILPFVCSHDSLAKFSVSGKPYYVKSDDLNLEIYDTVHPVIFEFSTPTWSRPINLIGYTCTGDDYDNDGWSCPILWYWLTGIRDKIQEDIYVDGMKIRDSSKFSTQFNCDELRENVFEGLYMDGGTRAEFINFLTSPTNCQSNQTTILLRDDRYRANNIDAPYRTMREKFFSEYYNLQTPVNRSNDAMYTNARYNFYSSGLFEYYIESRRWTEALNQCKSGRIPNSLITPQDLGSALTRVSNEASLNGLELLIGSDKGSRYFKEEGLVDCSFTEDSLFVVLQVPLKLMVNNNNNEPSTIFQLQPIPYYGQNGNICHMDLDERIKYVPDPATKLLVNSQDLKCLKEKFCHIPSEIELSNGISRKSCPQALYLEEDDFEICQESCSPKKSFVLPIITKVTDADQNQRHVMVFGNEGDRVEIVCPDFQKMEAINTLQGPVEVEIPCGCEIHKDGKSVFKAIKGCGSVVHVINILQNYQKNIIKTSNNTSHKKDA